MSYWELILISIGLSMDAFAVAAVSGIKLNKVNLKSMAIVGAYFGVFQGLMPVIGYMLATVFADKIVSVDHWIAFGLLSIIGGKMIIESLHKDSCQDRECPEQICQDRDCPKVETKDLKLTPKTMLPLAIATSIDALAMGLTFALLRVNIVSAAVSIGAITFALSMIGVKIGSRFGLKFKSKAELVGGIILVLLGVKILIEHLVVI